MKQIRYKGHFQSDPYIVSELQNLSTLRHENIIKMHDILISPNSVSIIMELAELGNLENFIKEIKHLSDCQIYQFYSHILRGVKFCHDNGIAHRDLTPSNILLSASMDMRIADFGLSMRCRGPSGEVILCNDYLGNSLYLAKEVLQETPHDPIPADVWTLGVLLFFMLFSDLPFHGSEERIIGQHHQFHSILKSKESTIGDKSTKLTSILLQIMEIVPDNRLNVSDILESLSENIQHAKL
ncbi:hypothetical protein FSP39_013239 [Pinctada imbricata]|uniref:Protein kinase domain-containing protein n=1 Tax=Pinctada imbricata TaxID=66713 RepID=A0AA89BPJ4_PINIB|nr:hypothetical protein FSP39_013239 [Pinctada imbricata]